MSDDARLALQVMGVALALGFSIGLGVGVALSIFRFFRR